MYCYLVLSIITLDINIIMNISCLLYLLLHSSIIIILFIFIISIVVVVCRKCIFSHSPVIVVWYALDGKSRRGLVAVIVAIVFLRFPRKFLGSADVLACLFQGDYR